MYLCCTLREKAYVVLPAFSEFFAQEGFRRTILILRTFNDASSKIALRNPADYPIFYDKRSSGVFFCTLREETFFY